MTNRISLAVFCAVFLANGCGSNTPAVNNPRNTAGLGPAPVSLSSTGSATVTAGDLSSAGNYVILAKSGIKNTGATSIPGNIGVSPIAATAITGFTLSAPPTASTTSPLVVGGGLVYAADYDPPTPTNLTTAVGNMQTAYTDAAGRNTPDFNELGAGTIGGLTLAPGLYTWTTTVNITTDITIKGTATDTWIFQTSKDVTMAAAMKVILSGGAVAKNIVWVVAGQVTIGTTAQFSGIVLSQTAITFLTGASLTGRLFAQTMVTLDSNVIALP